MSLLPFSTLSLIQPLLAPLCSLVRNQWLREADVDAWLRVLNRGWSLQRVYARVEARQWVADDMLELRLRPNAHWRGARPGQHLQLFVEHDGVRHSRSYSLTRIADDGCLEIAVKRQPGGRVSSLLVQQLCVGDVLELGQPDGDLSWPLDDQGVLLLAAGSGLTPLLGLLREALARGYNGPVTLLHYVRERGQKASWLAWTLGAAVSEPGVALVAERRYGAGRRIVRALSAGARLRPGRAPRAGLRPRWFRRERAPGVRCQQPQPAGGKLQPAELG